MGCGKDRGRITGDAAKRGTRYGRSARASAPPATPVGERHLADDFQQEVAFFGIERVSCESEGNGVDDIWWVRSFDTIEELRLALLAFSGRTTRSGC